MRWLFILTTTSLLISPCKISQAQVAQTPTNAPIEARAAAYPNRIEITVKISAHEDLKIAQDMTIAKGQIISDRIPEKTRLQAQKKQLELSLERVLSASIQEPPKPLPVPSVAPLPPVNYLEQEAAIERANIAISKRSASRGASSFKLETLTARIALIEERLDLAEDRIDYVSKKSWTNYISTNPVNIIQNIFGGGNVQRDRIAIASLEIRTATESS